MRRLSRWLAVAVLGGGLSHTTIARADAVDELGSRLNKFDVESQELGQGIKKPDSSPRKDDVMSRRLIDAEVAFGTGDFETAALLLYDYIAQPTKGHDYDRALYYLAESLFQKGDRVASRSYFTQLVADVGTSSKFYQQSLERLIELSLQLDDDAGVTDWLAALDRVPADKRQPSVPYVRGKYAFAFAKYDEAVTFFEAVPLESEYGFQAQYYLGTTHIAKKDLGKATQVFSALIKREPKTDDDRRVIELGQLALGRLYYERDQPSKAIDTYLLIDRKSDLFDEALYEVSWVYVKAKQFDKALRALELLALADPTSSKLPTVKLLEGNLRIRKAQMLEAKTEGNPIEEYDRADRMFAETHGVYEGPYQQLTEIIARGDDPQVFMAQITGRASVTFETNSTMPEIAASWIREEPDVQHVVAIETDLGDIEANIVEADRTIERLDAALASPNRINIYPTLATKRNRATEILEELFSIRQGLATHERALARKHASGAEVGQLDQLQANRQAIAKELAELPNAEVAYSERIERAKADFDAIDQRASEIQVVIDTTEATMVAIQKYISEVRPAPTAEQMAGYQQQIAELKLELQSQRIELAEVRREDVLGRDQAGTGDETALRAKNLRDQLRAALDTEHRAMAAIMARESGGDRARSDKIATLSAQAEKIMTKLDDVNQTIDAIVENALVDVRDTMSREKSELAAYRREFLLYEAESRELGGTVLGESFREVKTKFYDVLVRTDVGNVDVSWSQKEHTDEDLQRLNLDRQRELKQLRDEFKDLLDEEKRDSAPVPEPATPEAPAPTTTPTTGTPAATPAAGKGGTP